MSFVEFFWASWLGMILIPMVLMALLFIGFFVFGFVLEIIGRVGDWFRGGGQ